MANYKGFETEVEDEQDHESGIYLSISDLMSTLFLFFALLFITVLVQLKDYQEQVAKQKNIVIGTLQGQLKANNVAVKVNEETGDVSIQDKILFDEGSAELTPKGKAFLQKFIPVYSQVIFSQPAIENQITRVVIEGHTSSKGTYEQNLELSLQRSLSVSKYIFSKDLNFKTKPRLSKKILASGRGEIESQPIDNSADRKVVFRFQFKGEEFSQWYQKNQLPQKKAP